MSSDLRTPRPAYIRVYAYFLFLFNFNEIVFRFMAVHAAIARPHTETASPEIVRKQDARHRWKLVTDKISRTLKRYC